MKATLEFDFSKDFDDRVAHLRCVKANNMFNVLFDITHNLKRSLQRKLEVTDLSDMETLDLVFEEIAELIDQQGLNIDELT